MPVNLMQEAMTRQARLSRSKTSLSQKKVFHYLNMSSELKQTQSILTCYSTKNQTVPRKTIGR